MAGSSQSIKDRAMHRLTMRQVANGLGVTWRTVKAWINRGWLSASRPGNGRVVLIRRAAIRRLLREHPEIAMRTGFKGL